MQDQTIRGVVLHDQQAQPVQLFARRGCRRHTIISDAGAQREVKARPRARLGAQADLSAHHFNQLFRDREPEAGAAILSRRRAVSLGKRLEQRLCFFGGDADPRIGHQDFQRAASRFDLRTDFVYALDLHNDFAMLGKLDGVAYQIVQYLTQPAGVTVNARWNVGMNVARKFQPLVVGTLGHDLRHILHDVVQIERDAFQFQLPGLDLGKVQDVIDDPEQRFARTMDRLGEASRLLPEFGVEQELGHAEDAVHRCSNFVAHVRQKLAFQFAGLFRTNLLAHELLGIPPFRNVAHVYDDAFHRRVVEHVDCSGLEVFRRTVAETAEFESRPQARLGRGCFKRPIHGSRIALVDAPHWRLADHLFRREAEHALQRRTRVAYREARVQHHHRVGRIFDERSEMRLAARHIGARHAQPLFARIDFPCHEVEVLRELADLVAMHDVFLWFASFGRGCIGLRAAEGAAAQRLGGVRENTQRADHDAAEKHVDHQCGESEDADKNPGHQRCAALAARIHCCRGHIDDLRADHFIHVPAEAVLRAVRLDHARGCGLGNAVALETARRLDADRSRREKHVPIANLAETGLLWQFRVFAEVLDQGALETIGLIARVGRVERGLLVQEVLVFVAAAEELENFARGVPRHRLADERAFRVKERLNVLVDILGRVLAYRVHRLQEDLRF